MTPGEHIIITGSPDEARRKGWQVRDTILVILPGPKVLVASLCRWPLDGSVCENVLRHGKGGINIGKCRIGTEPRRNQQKAPAENLNMLSRPGGEDAAEARGLGAYGVGAKQASGGFQEVVGRWPTNLILVHGSGCVGAPIWECDDDCPVHLLDEMTGLSQSMVRRGGEGEPLDPGQESWRFRRAEGGYTDAGTASRFFPTFKCLDDAMAWLQKLIA
jgi:hypothetical protein